MPIASSASMSCIEPFVMLWLARKASSPWVSTSTMALPTHTTSIVGWGMGGSSAGGSGRFGRSGRGAGQGQLVVGGDHPGDGCRRAGELLTSVVVADVPCEEDPAGDHRHLRLRLQVPGARRVGELEDDPIVQLVVGNGRARLDGLEQLHELGAQLPAG